MKKVLLLLLFVPLFVFAEQMGVCRLEQGINGEYTIICEGSGLQIRYEDVTNEVYAFQNCELLKSSLLSTVASLNQKAVATYDARIGIEDGLRGLWANQNIAGEQDYIDFEQDTIRTLESMAENLEDIIADTSSSGPSGNIYNTLDNIACGSCPDNGGGGSGGSGCCDVDLTEIINRMITAEQQRQAINDQLGYIVEGVVSIAGSMDIVIEGLGSITNLLSYVNYSGVQNVAMNRLGFSNVVVLRYTNDGRFAQYPAHIDSATISSRDYGWLPSLWWQNLDQLKMLTSINNFLFYDHLVSTSILTNNLISLHDASTNYFTFFQGEVGVNGVLEDWQSEEVSGTYYEFLTNHYLSVVRGDQLSGNQSSKTNWFSRIETLLASLVFNDVGNTNAFDSASQSASNSVNNVKDNFDSVFDGVSSAPSSQMELVSDIEQSMYDSLRTFSTAFSSASLPSSVRLIYVYKSSGSRSRSFSADTVDVTVPVEGKLMDFVEIMRSASTLCWVFFGLWFMFKFSVWTVKKIYMLIRYVIDFFNMVAGGK